MGIILRRFVKDAARYNKEDEDVTYGITLFADLTEAEAENMLGFNGTNFPTNEDDEPQEINPKFNLGANHQSKFGPAKNQKRTNACWAFAATAVLEGHTSIINGKYTALSEQEVADCTSGSTVRNGGFHNHALEAIQKNQHLASSADYPFTYRDGYSCNTQHQNALPFKITSVNRVNGDGGLATALASGPVASGMGFDRRLRAYRSGIYSDRGCMNVKNHAVTTVGYTDTYWIVRNSWSTGWGESGHVRFTRQHENMCHISGHAYYITVQKGQEKEE